MKLATYFSAFGIIAVLFGVGFVLVPDMIGPIYGIPPAPYTAMMSRFFGGALLLIGLLYWLARELNDDAAKCAILKANVGGGVVATAVSIWAATSGMENQMAWSTVGLYVWLTLGALYYLAAPARRQ